MEFSRQEYWSELPFPSPGDLPDLGIEPGLPHCGQMLYSLSHQGILQVSKHPAKISSPYLMEISILITEEEHGYWTGN